MSLYFKWNILSEWISTGGLSLTGVQPVASLGNPGGRVVLGHTLNTQTLMKTDEQKKVLSKFIILCWAAFIAILGHMWPASCGLATL